MANSKVQGAKPLDMLGAMTIARETVASITGLPVDNVSRCAPADGRWKVRVEVIESRARLGDNDFLAVYDLLIGSDGGLEGFERVGRYNRTDGFAQIAA
jgi:hypothetical protein